MASVASSAGESAAEQAWPRARRVTSPGSSASSDLDSAHALANRRPKVSAHVSALVTHHAKMWPRASKIAVAWEQRIARPGLCAGANQQTPQGECSGCSENALYQIGGTHLA